MNGGPRVSVIVIFLDEERFLAEAIESVRAQDLDDWELILVDDGSTDAGPAIARRYAAVDSRIRFVQHPGGANRGMSASRNLGLAQARAGFVAFCDADDAWLPHKLRHQLAEIGDDATVAMTYGPILRWHGWTGEPDAHHHEDLCGVGPRKRGAHPFVSRTVDPPALVPLIIRSDYYCPAGGLIRTDALRSVGGFEDRFRGSHEDGVAMVKLCAQHRVHVSDEVTYLYRIHPRSHTQSVPSRARSATLRRDFVDWADEYLESHGRHTAGSRRAVQVACARIAWDRRPALLGVGLRRRTLAGMRRFGRAVLTRSARDAARARWFAFRRASVPVGPRSISSTGDRDTTPGSPREGG